MEEFSDRGSIPLGSTITHTYEHPTTFVVWRNVFAITVPVK